MSQSCGEHGQRLPLDGIRVLDLGRHHAGPIAGMYLGYFGAEVVKIESCANPDPLRLAARGMYPRGEPGKDPWNRSGLVNERNRNKYGITIDLNSEAGRHVFRRLLAKADVITENLSATAAEKLGLEYSWLKSTNPAIVWLSLRSRGSTGPDKDMLSFGPTLESSSGYASVRGYEGEIHGYLSLGLSDIASGIMGIGLVIAALYDRKRTGLGLHVDVSQLELSSCLAAEAFVRHFVTGEVPCPMGNRDAWTAPCGCYKCRGDDEWVTLRLPSEDKWDVLCRIIGRPDIALDPRFALLTARFRNLSELDRIVEEWTTRRGAYEIMDIMQKAGIPAAPVLNAQTVFADRHFVQRRAFPVSNQPGVGDYRLPGLPMRFSGRELPVRLPAPRLGEHNHHILADWLGMSDNEIAQLESDGVVGTQPRQD